MGKILFLVNNTSNAYDSNGICFRSLEGEAGNHRKTGLERLLAV